jgi:hypothetical protein
LIVASPPSPGLLEASRQGFFVSWVQSEAESDM